MYRHALSTIALFVMLSAASLGQQAPPAADPPAQTKPAEAQQPPAPRTPAQLVNVRLDLTIAEQRGNAPMESRAVVLTLADRESGRVRSSQGAAMLNVDARPEIMRDGKIKVFFALEYRRTHEGEKEPTYLNQSQYTLLEDGKPLKVSQSADPAVERAAVVVELKAAIVR